MTWFIGSESRRTADCLPHALSYCLVLGAESPGKDVTLMDGTGGPCRQLLPLHLPQPRCCSERCLANSSTRLKNHQ